MPAELAKKLLPVVVARFVNVAVAPSSTEMEELVIAVNWLTASVPRPTRTST